MIGRCSATKLPRVSKENPSCGKKYVKAYNWAPLAKSKEERKIMFDDGTCAIVVKKDDSLYFLVHSSFFPYGNMNLAISRHCQ